MIQRLLVLLLILPLVCSMQCGSPLIRFVEQIDVQVEPNPVETVEGIGDFEIEIAIPPGKEFNRFDSVSFQVLSEQGLLGTMTFDPDERDWRAVHRITKTMSIVQPLEDQSLLSIELVAHKKAKYMTSPKLQFAYTIEMYKND